MQLADIKDTKISVNCDITSTSYKTYLDYDDTYFFSTIYLLRINSWFVIFYHFFYPSLLDGNFFGSFFSFFFSTTSNFYLFHKSAINVKQGYSSLLQYDKYLTCKLLPLLGNRVWQKMGIAYNCNLTKAQLRLKRINFKSLKAAMLFYYENKKNKF